MVQGVFGGGCKARGTDRERETAKLAKNAKRRRGKGKWRRVDRDANGDVIPTGAKRSGGISQPLVIGNWLLSLAWARWASGWKPRIERG